MTGVPKIIFFIHETPRGRTAPQRGNRDLTCTFYMKRFQNAAELHIPAQRRADSAISGVTIPD